MRKCLYCKEPLVINKFNTLKKYCSDKHKRWYLKKINEKKEYKIVQITGR